MKNENYNKQLENIQKMIYEKSKEIVSTKIKLASQEQQLATLKVMQQYIIDKQEGRHIDAATRLFIEHNIEKFKEKLNK